MADAVSTTEEMVPVRLNPKTHAGNPSKIEEGSAVLSIVSGGATARPATDQEKADDASAGNTGLVGFILSEDVPGVSTWQVVGDADLGAGVKTITDGGSYTYNDPLADNLGATIGSPVAKVA
jgi:hypothetical protein